ncbi:MAG: hypothetical protein KJ063_24790 [Anaerolineae bacterium]|nr:hypothetical protein [Anaerolineae bacterium]
MKTRVVILFLIAFLLTGCAVAIGSAAQANVGSLVVNSEGDPVAAGESQAVVEAVEPPASSEASNSQRFGGMWVFLLSVTGLIFGILTGLYLASRSPEEKEPQAYF